MTDHSNRQHTSSQDRSACRCDRKPVLLVIDDEEGPRESIRMIFKGTCRVLQAENGEQGLSLVRSEKPDAVILDLKMDGMSGMEVLARIRSLDPDLPVIILTAYGTMESATQAMSGGAIEFLSKPFDVDTIVQIVQDAIRRRSGSGS